MLRALVVLLVLANLGFYAWTEGWLDGIVGVRSIGDREPERLQRQVRPTAVRIVAAEAAAAEPPPAEPPPAAALCLEAGPFGDADLGAAQAVLQAALPSGGWVTTRVLEKGTWIVYMGKFPNREVMARKAEELARRKLPYDEVRDAPALAPGLSLGHFDDRGLADQALERFVQQGVRSARVVETVPPAGLNWLRAERADAALSSQLTAVKAAALGKGFVPCDTAGRRN